jgi:UDP-N-acetylmuramate--alanine ligase
VEIAAVLAAARDVTKGRVIAVVQPHRYTRLRDLHTEFCGCFEQADAVLVADVYAAGESPIPGVDSDKLAEGLKAAGRERVFRVNRDTLADRVAAEAGPGDLVVCLGAGDITAWARALPEELGARKKVAVG